MEENKISLVVLGQPQHKQRPKWSRTRMYSPSDTVNYETYIKEMFVISYPDFVPLEGALRMTIIAYMIIWEINKEEQLDEQLEEAITDYLLMESNLKPMRIIRIK